MPKKRRESKRLRAEQQPSGIFWAVGTVAGRRVRKSLGTREQERANELVAQYESRLWKRHSYGEAAVRQFEEAALSYLQQGGDDTFIKGVTQYFRGRNVGSITPAEIRAAAFALYPNAGSATRNRQAIVPARAVLNHAHQLGWCGAIRVKQFDVPKSRKHKPVDKAWIRAFMDEADRSKLPHLSALVLFMHQTGARVSEAIRLTGEHVDLGNRVAVLERTKTDEWSPRHLTAELVARMGALDPTPGVRLFVYTDPKAVNRVMKRVAARAGIEPRTTHSAGRHSFATNALANTGDIKGTMDSGGWKSARLFLETYVHSNNAGAKIARAFDDETGPIDINKAYSLKRRLGHARKH